jgi:hypothetical protein
LITFLSLDKYTSIIIFVIIVMKSSSDRDNKYCHCVIQRIADFAITLNYHPAGCVVNKELDRFHGVLGALVHSGRRAVLNQLIDYFNY